MRARGRSVVALVAAVALAAVACGPSRPPGATGSPAPSASPSGSAQAGGELVVGLSAETESMDPYLTFQNAGTSIMHAMFDTLLEVAPDGTLGPGLATQWTVVDDTTIELTLRDGVTFHNGEPFDADAVKASLYRVTDRDMVTGEPVTDQAELLNTDMRGDYLSVETVEVVDPLRVRLRLSRPDAALLSALGRLFVVPPDYLAEVKRAGFLDHPVGTGPFRFVEWVKDDHSTFDRNPDYWDSPRGQPLVDRVVFRPLLDPPARLNELTTGGIHLLQDASVDDLGAIEAAGGTFSYLETDPHHVEIWLTSDGIPPPDASPATLEAIEALTKPEVRRALNLAVDRQTIIETLLGGLGTPMSHLFVPGELGFDPDIPAFGYDPAEARRLLAEAGYPDGLEVTLDYCTCDRLDPFEAVVADLAEVGVRATIKPIEITQFNATWGRPSDRGPGTDPLRSSRLGFHDPHTFLRLWFQTPSQFGGYLSRYSNPQMDALIEEQVVQYDTEERVDTLHRIAELSHEDPAAIYLWSSPNLYAVGAGVTGWQPHYLGYVPVVNVGVPG